MINELIRGVRRRPGRRAAARWTRCSRATGARWPGRSPACRPAACRTTTRPRWPPRPPPAPVPVLGITGTGGSGKSSLTDELVRRFRTDQQDKLRVAVLAVDPTRRRGGGALLGDRIRMNALDSDARVLPLAGHPRAPRELPERIDGHHRRVPGRRLRPGHPGDARASARATPPSSALADVLAVRDDAGVRRRLPAGEDRHARLRRRGGDQQVRAARRRRRAARRVPPADPQPGRVRRPAARTCRCSAPARPRSTTTASPPCTSTWPGCSAARGLPLAEGVLPAGRRPGLHRRGLGHPAGQDRLPGRDRRRPSAATTSDTARQAAGGAPGAAARPPSGLSSPKTVAERSVASTSGTQARRARSRRTAPR